MFLRCSFILISLVGRFIIATHFPDYNVCTHPSWDEFVIDDNIEDFTTKLNDDMEQMTCPSASASVCCDPDSTLDLGCTSELGDDDFEDQAVNNPLDDSTTPHAQLLRHALTSDTSALKYQVIVSQDSDDIPTLQLSNFHTPKAMTPDIWHNVDVDSIWGMMVTETCGLVLIKPRAIPTKLRHDIVGCFYYV